MKDKVEMFTLVDLPLIPKDKDKLHKLRQEIAHFHKCSESNIYGRLLGEKTQLSIRTKMMSSVKYILEMDKVLHRYFKS